jgi:para-nitrobenzyl esterase
MTRRASVSDVLVVGLLLGAVHCSRAPEKAAPAPDVSPSTQATSQDATPRLEGTSWRLIEFRGGDETILRPDDPAKYTIAFQFDGRLRARIDCNRGMGTWRSPAPPQLELGPLALTRAMCPPGSLHDHLVKQWPYVRSYVIRDGHLFLSLMADGGIYEFEPMS